MCSLAAAGRVCVLITGVFTAGLCGGGSAACGAAPPRAIRHSDVVFMYDDPKLYAAYGCTVLGWAGDADAQHIDQAHARGVRLFSTSVGFLTEFQRVVDFDPNFLEAACRNLAGEPFVVPWLWDHKYKGQRAWWWCTNSPLYRRYLQQRLVEVMRAGPDGLHIDDYRGTSGAVTWLPACFCPHCMAGFREYLGKAVPREKLAALGIKDLDAFDYRKFLLDRGVTLERYNNDRTKLPLAAEFLDFQVRASTAFVAEYRHKAEELRGRPLALCVNSGLDDPQALAITPQLSYFCSEVEHQAASRAMPLHPVYVYKLADGLDRPVAATAGGGDWAYIAEHKLPGLVRLWIALAYAHGQNFMPPHRQWCYTRSKGTHWYAGPTEEFVWLYQFVRDNARLLDGYEAVASLALVYDNAARRRWQGDIQPVATALAQRNMPFSVVVAGDDWLDYRLDSRRLDQFRAVIVSKDFGQHGGRCEPIEKCRAEGRLLVWPDDARLERLVGRPVEVEGSQQVMVVVRAAANARGPLAIHLVSRDYDRTQDRMLPQSAFSVRLRQDLFPGRKFTQALLHAPRSQPLRLEVRSDAGHTVIRVPRLDLWAIVELSELAASDVSTRSPVQTSGSAIRG